MFPASVRVMLRYDVRNSDSPIVLHPPPGVTETCYTCSITSTANYDDTCTVRREKVQYKKEACVDATRQKVSQKPNRYG